MGIAHYCSSDSKQSTIHKMSKKKNDQNLLIPGANGWNIWSCTPSEISLLQGTSESRALEIKKFPQNKPLIMAFPVKELTALELWVPKQEKDSVPDLVDLQVENKGLSRSQDLGTLHQHSHVADSPNGDRSLYSIDVLRAPEEGSLPSKSPNRFNVSPRCFPFENNAVTLWQEFGKWVFAFTDSDGDVVHYQGATSHKLDKQVSEELRFVVGHLQIQQIITSRPNQYIVWMEESGLYPEGYDTFEGIYGDALILQEKPTPVMPPEGTLLPADTRAERVEAKRKQQQNILSTLLGLVVLGLLGYAGFKLWDLEKQVTVAEAKAKQLEEQAGPLLSHSGKWAELGPLVDTENTPVNLLLKCTQAIPARKNLRLKRAEFKNQLPAEGYETVLAISLSGEAEDFAVAKSYDGNLKDEKERFGLSNIAWTNTEPSQKNTGWGFTYQGKKK